VQVEAKTLREARTQKHTAALTAGASETRERLTPLCLQLSEELPRPLVVGYELDQLPGIANGRCYLATLATDRRQPYKDLWLSWMPRVGLREDFQGARALVCRVQGHAEDVVVVGILWSQRSCPPQGTERLQLPPSAYQEEAKRMVQGSVVGGHGEPLP
jgi:hypothetical protein